MVKGIDVSWNRKKNYMKSFNKFKGLQNSKYFSDFHRTELFTDSTLSVDGGQTMGLS